MAAAICQAAPYWRQGQWYWGCPGWEPQTQSLTGVSVQVASLEETHGTLVREGLRWGEGDQLFGLPVTKKFPKMWDV